MPKHVNKDAFDTEPFSIENEMRDLIEAGERTPPPGPETFAQPDHPGRLSATTKIMCDAIDEVCTASEKQVGAQITELKTKLTEAESLFAEFKTNMREAADLLKEQITGTMGQYEEVISKMQDSSFGRKMLEKAKAQVGKPQ